MIVVAVEYNYINPDRDSLYCIIKNTILNQIRKYGETYRKVEWKYKIQFFDKIRNKTKSITTRSGIEKTIVASNKRYEYFNINKFTIIIEGDISQNAINTYMKYGNVPLMWEKFFLSIANNRYYIFNFCNRPKNTFDRQCREWYIYNIPEANNIRMLDDEINNYGFYFI